jgi:hypothetical protein
MALDIPCPGDPRVLRCVELPGTDYALLTWDTGRYDRRGQSYIGYAFYRVTEVEPIFAAEDFAGSPMHADDSDETLRCLLGFLTLRKGDTDADYFDAYTARQLEFRDGPDIEELGLWALDDAGDMGYEFSDCEGW